MVVDYCEASCEIMMPNYQLALFQMKNNIDLRDGFYNHRLLAFLTENCILVYDKKDSAFAPVSKEFKT